MVSKEQKWKEAENLKEFYIDLMEGPKNIIKYYFSDDVVLDWFGRTVKGRENVASFLKEHVIPVRHIFSQARPVEKIGFRDTHVIKAPRYPRRMLRSFLMSPPRPTQFKTPKKQHSRASSSNNNNNNEIIDTVTPKDIVTPARTSRKLFASPAKKMKMSPPEEVDVGKDVMESENEYIAGIDVRYLTTEGSVEFHRSSLKKLQPETKWQRPCKLHLAYSAATDLRDSTIYMIIYEGNVKCRKNLFKNFGGDETEG